MRKLSRSHREVIGQTVTVLLPEHPHLNPETRGRVRDDVTAFVASQIDALPPFLNLPYRFALTVFDLAPLLRHRRRFRRLDVNVRAALLADWDMSALAAKRGYVRLIRSCAVLAYYDHPAVLRVLQTDVEPMVSPDRSAAL